MASLSVERSTEHATPPRSAGTSDTPRVLIIPPLYDDEGGVPGGGERYTRRYAHALARRTPTTIAHFGSEVAESFDGPLRLRRVRGRNLNQLHFPLSRSFVSLLEESDVVHSMVFPKPITDR